MGIIHQIRDAGIVGCGGAGFPTHKKLSKDIEYFIVNGAECEPLLRTDRYIMLHRAPDLVRAITALKAELNITHCVIALKHHYQAEAEALRQAIQAAGADITVHELESFYPAGDEQTIVYEVTGRVVPPAGIPMAVGAVVNNVATVCAIADAMDGLPFTQKYLTVTGDVRCPTVLQVPIGTSYADCLELAGGPLARDYFIVNGGPMMGKPVTMEEARWAVVTKTTSGILVLPAGGYHARTHAVDLERMLQRARSACIQCSACTQLCPRHMLGHPLQPHRIMRALSAPGGLPGRPAPGPRDPKRPALLRVRHLRDLCLPHEPLPPEDQQHAQEKAGGRRHPLSAPGRGPVAGQPPPAPAQGPLGASGCPGRGPGLLRL